MTNAFTREARYLVIKVKDAERFLSGYQLESLADIADTVEAQRLAAGKAKLECVVVERHWPEYESTWRAIEARVTGAQAQHAPSVPDDGFKRGVECAVAFVARKAELYAIRFGHDDMGGLSFGRGPQAQSKMDHYTSLMELADELCNLFDVQAPSVPAGWLERGLTELENIRNHFDDSTFMNDKTLIERLFIAMTTTPEVKP